MDESKTILFLGDVLPYKPFKFRNSLKTVINLECPITGGNTPITGKVNFSVKENHLLKTFNSSLLAVNLGNNHILDYGVSGLNSTINELEKSDLEYFGTKNPSGESHNPLTLHFAGIRIAFLSAISEKTTPIVEFDDFNYLKIIDINDLAKNIGNIRNSVDRIVLYLHWGVEESSYPSRNEIATARNLIDAGADIIIGAHAHSPQPIEKYNKGLIAYNLGNFIMPSFKRMPSYFDENGSAQSEFSKRLMLWNRISWGLAVDMENLEFRIKKYAFAADRIFELSGTPYDRYIEMNSGILNDSYEKIVENHLKKRELKRKIRDFIQSPRLAKKL